MAATPEQHLTSAPYIAADSTSKNYWVSREEYPFVTWSATFPNGPIEPRDYLEFLKAVLAAAEQEEVFRVVRAPLRKSDRKYYPEEYWDYRAQPGGPTYAQFVEQVFAETGKLILPWQLFSSPGFLEEYRVIAPGKLSYYETDGRLVEAEVEDIGALLRRLRPYEIPDGFSEEEWLAHEDYRNDNYDDYKAYGSALFFYGQLGSDETEWAAFKAWENLPAGMRNPEDEPYVRETYLTINLYTDIWFPKVKGFIENIRPLSPHIPGRMFDNQELALRHTPRLNRFLRSVKKLIEGRGGHMDVDCSNFQEFYGSMCSEGGIILDS
jgi:hypothetical protein